MGWTAIWAALRTSLPRALRRNCDCAAFATAPHLRLRRKLAIAPQVRCIQARPRERESRPWPGPRHPVACAGARRPAQLWQAARHGRSHRRRCAPVSAPGRRPGRWSAPDSDRGPGAAQAATGGKSRPPMVPSPGLPAWCPRPAKIGPKARPTPRRATRTRAGSKQGRPPPRPLLEELPRCRSSPLPSQTRFARISIKLPVPSCPVNFNNLA